MAMAGTESTWRRQEASKDEFGTKAKRENHLSVNISVVNKMTCADASPLGSPGDPEELRQLRRRERAVCVYAVWVWVVRIMRIDEDRPCHVLVDTKYSVSISRVLLGHT